MADSLEDPGLPAGVVLRPMQRADIPTGVALCRASRWNQTAREWELFLTIAGEAAIVAECDGRVVGTAVTVPYQPRMGWVAMVLVDPAYRGRGIGRTLLTRAINGAAPEVTLRLDATPAGRALYLRLGFTDEFSLARWRRIGTMGGSQPETITPSPGISVQVLRDADWPEIAALDREAFGADRGVVLDWCRRGAPEFAWVSRRTAEDAPLDGFALGRHGHDADHIGPVVARTPEHARSLVAACLGAVRRSAVILDVPDQHTSMRDWLRTRRFELERPFTRMRRGPGGRPADVALLFAAAGPELG